MEARYGALEAGGTKMVCAITDVEGGILDRCRIPTGHPEDCLPRIVDFFRGRVDALGIGTFGPVDVDPDSIRYGDIGACVKDGWSGFPLGRRLSDELGVPFSVDTDVNAACLGECTFGSSRGLGTVAYITVGTGIGVGLCISGKPFHGNRHPEGGHIKVARIPGDVMEGVCPYHPECIEGLASGPALRRRFCRDPSTVPRDDPGWSVEAEYLSQLVCTCLLMYSPDRIVMGGGVMGRTHLFGMVREKAVEHLGGYLDHDSLDDIVVPASLDGDQGVLGAAQLAIDSAVMKLDASGYK